MSRATILLGIMFALGSATPARGWQGASPPGDAATAVPSVPTFDTLKQRADQARIDGRLAEAVDLYARAVRLRPSWTEGYWYLGTTAYEADRHRDCRDAFARVVERQPEHGAAWAFQGLCEFKLGDHASALKHLTRADDLGMGDDGELLAVAQYHRAILLAQAGQFERAFEIDAGFVRGGNMGPEVLDALGLALLRIARLPSEVPPTDRDLVRLAGRAAAYTLARMKEEAEDAFRQLVATYPTAPNVHYAYGTYLARERPAEAIAQFRIELERSPSHVLARVHIAQELIKQGDVAQAAPYATEAARLAPRNFVARKLAGQVKLQAGDVAGAVAELEAARSLEPTSPSVRFQLARAYQRAGRTADAERERTEFKRLDAIRQQQRVAAGPSAEEPEDP
jgi:tetratricopeptide (TPR) repeat protein